MYYYIYNYMYYYMLQDGHIHIVDGATLRPLGPPRQGHAGFVSGLCLLQSRTTRRVWSHSLSDGTVCVWKVDAPESQLT